MSDNKPSKGGGAGRVRRPGNPVARSPLLRKGGVHERSAGGQRARARLSTLTALEEWLEEREEAHGREQEEGGFGPPFLFRHRLDRQGRLCFKGTSESLPGDLLSGESRRFELRDHLLQGFAQLG